MKYVALLRGINVGGKNKVGMAELKRMFEQAGMTDVRSYINSGNILFTSDHSRQQATEVLEKAIHATFGFPVNIVIFTAEDIIRIAQAIPKAWVNDDTMKCDVMYLWDDIDNPDIVKQVTIRPDIDDVSYVPGALLWRVDRTLVTRSGLLRIVGTPAYKQMTIRNCNTARKLASLVG